MPSKPRRGAQEPHGPHRRTAKVHTEPRPSPAVDHKEMEHNAAPLRHPRGHCVPAIGGDPRHAAVWWDQVPMCLRPTSFCFRFESQSAFFKDVCLKVKP